MIMTTIKRLSDLLKVFFFCQDIYRNDDLNLRKEIKPVKRILRDGDTKWVSHFHMMELQMRGNVALMLRKLCIAM